MKCRQLVSGYQKPPSGRVSNEGEINSECCPSVGLVFVDPERKGKFAWEMGSASHKCSIFRWGQDWNIAVVLGTIEHSTGFHFLFQHHNYGKCQLVLFFTCLSILSDRTNLVATIWPAPTLYFFCETLKGAKNWRVPILGTAASSFPKLNTIADLQYPFRVRVAGSASVIGGHRI